MKKLVLLLTVFVGTVVFAADIRLDGSAGDWEMISHGGAKGSMVEVRKGVFKITKENAEGILEFRYKKQLMLQGPKRWFLRSEFQSKRNAHGTMFFYRLPRPGKPANYTASGSMTFAPDSLLTNTPGNSWYDRIYSIEFKNKHLCEPAIIVIGNPAEFLVRDIYLTQKEKYADPDKHLREFKYSQAEVDAILAKRSHSTAELVHDQNGDVQLLINGKPAVPSAYKHESKLSMEYMFRNEDFYEAGVPMLRIALPLCHNLRRNEIILGKGKYNWKMVDDIFYRALRRAPHGNFIVAFSVYEPYIGWARENFDELWQNEKGERGLGNNCHLKFFSNEPEKQNYKEKVAFWASYSSMKWREDYRQIIQDVIGYVMKQPYGKAVVGFSFSGGDDGQFQYRKNDYSRPALQAFYNFLRKKYGALENMNRIWKTSYAAFEDVKVPKLIDKYPSETPFLAPGVKSDFREFQETQGWELREFFSKALKDAAGKKVITLCYGAPNAFPSAGMEFMPHLDVQVAPQSYPARRNSMPYQSHPELTYKLNKKLWFNELDLRSWRSDIKRELVARWMNPTSDFASWRSSHRKVVAPSFAQRQGWWYFSLNYQGGRFFDAPEIMEDIKKVQQLYAQMQALPYRKFRPDVCLVSDLSSLFAIEAQTYAAYGSAVTNAGNGNGITFALEISGVPYDSAYLKDIIKHPELQDYKVYIFMHNAILTSAEREAIDKLLKNKGKTLIWVYSSGYLDENGKAPENIHKLTGFEIKTEEKYARQQVYSVPSHPLNQGRREVMSYIDMTLSLQLISGLENIWGSPCQIFYPQNIKTHEIVAEDSNGNVAGAYREFKNWNSLYLAAPRSLTSELFNSVAAKAGAYRTGKAGHTIAMNGNFISIHPLYDDVYEFITPPGVTEVIDAESGKVVGKAPKVTLNLTSGKTVWFFMK